MKWQFLADQSVCTISPRGFTFKAFTAKANTFLDLGQYGLFPDKLNSHTPNDMEHANTNIYIETHTNIIKSCYFITANKSKREEKTPCLILISLCQCR